jgi:uncharacterized cofD-like protein
MIDGPRVVVIGGGSGLAILLRGLKQLTSNITAIVTVSDDGGGSGVLREDLGMLPPGDIRNCIIALANTEPLMEQLLQYRFPEGKLKGQSFGNLLLAAMNGISVNFEEAIQRVHEILAVSGRVVPVSLMNIHLYGKLYNDVIIKGESKIGKASLQYNSAIERVFIQPAQPPATEEALLAIQQADIIVLGPGSLYTSIIPNLLTDGIVEAIKKSKAKKAYISNVMTQPGETSGMGVKEHVMALQDHSVSGLVDLVFINTGVVDEHVELRYKHEGAQLILSTQEDLDYLRYSGIRPVLDNFIEVKQGYIRHDALKLSKALIEAVDVRAFVR